MQNIINIHNKQEINKIKKRVGRESKFVHDPLDYDSHYTWKFFINFPDKLYKDIARTKTDEEIAELVLQDKLCYLHLILPRNRMLHISELIEDDPRYSSIEYMLIDPDSAPVYHGDYI